MQTINVTIFPNDLSFISEESLKCQIKQFSSKCLEKLFAVKQNDIDFYINLLKLYILKHPLYWYTNPLVKLIKEHVGNELPTCFFNYIKEIEEDIEFQRTVNESILQYQNIINNNEDITEEQVEELLAIIKISPKRTEEILNFIIYKIISKRLIVNDQLYSIIFFAFIDFFKQKSGENFYAFTKVIPDLIINNKKVTTNATAKKRYGNTFIFFNTKFITCDKIVKNLFVFFHEFWHTIQDRENITPSHLREMFKMDEFLSGTLSNYKNINYQNLSYESDANLNALIMLHQFLNSINISWYNDIIQAKIEHFRELRKNNIRINSFGVETTLEEYYQSIYLSQNPQVRNRKL